MKYNNIGFICTRLQCEMGKHDHVAFRFIKPEGLKQDLTFLSLESETNKFANLLQRLNFKKNDVFFTFLPKCQEQIIAFLGALKKNIIIGTLFSNFGEEAVIDRLIDSGAKGIITKTSIYRKLFNIWEKIDNLIYIILIDIDKHVDSRVLSYRQLMAESNDNFNYEYNNLNDPSVLHYTSGSTGKPKGVLHIHNSIVMQKSTTQEILQLQENDIFWCTADPGWVTGTSYGIIGPCSLGVTQICYEGGFNTKIWFNILENEKVNVWYTAPTALRMIKQELDVDISKFNLEHLRYIFSVGEPLNPEIYNWFKKKIGKDIYDTYFQTETGAIMVANRPGVIIKPGSMGIPVDGVNCEILDDEGNVLSNNTVGNLCFKVPWPSMFVSYLNKPNQFSEKFISGYYYTGDKAYKTNDGYFWFVGRADDIINTAGHLVSPFEIESVLLEMDEIADAAVVGVNDPILFEKPVAFVKLNSKIDIDDLKIQIRLVISKKISPIAAPADIILVDKIPKNKSGKIMRRYLRAMYEGKSPGDISTLDE